MTFKQKQMDHIHIPENTAPTIELYRIPHLRELMLSVSVSEYLQLTHVIFSALPVLEPSK